MKIKAEKELHEEVFFIYQCFCVNKPGWAGQRKVGRFQEGASVKVYNVNGAAVVASARLTITTQSLPVQTLAAGIYYVQVINGGVITTKKIIKQ